MPALTTADRDGQADATAAAGDEQGLARKRHGCLPGAADLLASASPDDQVADRDNEDTAVISYTSGIPRSPRPP